MLKLGQVWARGVRWGAVREERGCGEMSVEERRTIKKDFSDLRFRLTKFKTIKIVAAVQ